MIRCRWLTLLLLLLGHRYERPNYWISSGLISRRRSFYLFSRPISCHRRRASRPPAPAQMGAKNRGRRFRPRECGFGACLRLLLLLLLTALTGTNLAQPESHITGHVKVGRMQRPVHYSMKKMNEFCFWNKWKIALSTKNLSSDNC